MTWESLAQLGNYLLSDAFFSILAAIAVWGFFISGIDDLFIDLRYLVMVLFKGGEKTRIRMIDAEKLSEKPVAVMVPAWQEAEVIRRMLMRNVTNIDYTNYHLFVGTYPNDAETLKEVEGTIRYYRRLRSGLGGVNGAQEGKRAAGDFVHMVVGPKPGPTNKADNLNHIYRHILAAEEDMIRNGELSAPFEIFVLHDCEDVIHPKEFKLFNFLMTNVPQTSRPKNEPYREQFDFVQLPVFPLEIGILPDGEEIAPLTRSLKRWRTINPAKWIAESPRTLWRLARAGFLMLRNIKRHVVSATYMDEFAEHHTKDMVVRREIEGLVPSAGVGTGISRSALGRLAGQNKQNDIFNDVHLTEDYEISLALKNLGMKQYFVVEPVKMLKYWQSKLDETYEVDEFVATKEFFPDSIRRSIRQKTRWIMGITYQTMFPGRKDNPFVDFFYGWQGTMVTKYTLLRDRKSLVTNYINILGYVVFFYCLVKVILVEMIDYDWSFARIFPPSSYIWWLLLFNAVLMVERFLQRFHAVRKIYGLKQSVYFLLRTVFVIGLILGNFINFMATLGATRRYFGWLLSSKFLPAKKTAQKDATATDAAQPGSAAHEKKKSRLVWGKTEHAYLSEDQMREYVNRLGALAVRNRLLKPEQLTEALEVQRRDRKKLGEVLKNMGVIDDASFSLLYAQQLSMPSHEIDSLEIDTALLEIIPEDLAIEYRMVPLTLEPSGALVVAVADPVDEESQRRLQERVGRKLRFVITYESDLDFSRRRAYGKLVKTTAVPVQKLGVYLLERNHITETQLSEALYLQKVQRKPLGEVLMGMGLIDEFQLDAYFRETLGIAFTRIDPDRTPAALLERFPRAFCQIYRTVPLRENGETITMAIANFALREIVASLERQLEKKVEVVLAPEEDIQKAIEAGYARFDEATLRSRLLGNRLIEAGVIDPPRLDEALKQQRAKGQRLGEVLVSYGYCDERDFLNVYAKDLLLPVVNIKALQLDPALAQLYSRTAAAERTLAPLYQDGDAVTFALPYDFTQNDIRSIEERFPHGKIHYVLAVKSDIREAIRVIYADQAGRPA
ncbi:MAG: hypothetical protein C4523_12140 [Myxococcales bacterium]|nr:MAG: hypothetical protein C4523_12140 [Myxococcales bacterium]